MHLTYKIVLGLVLLCNTVCAQTLQLEINGLRNNKGAIQLSFYTNAESFEQEIPEMVRIFSKTDVLNGKKTITINQLKAGTYGIALIDDENENSKLDFWLMIPKEGFAFSNFPFEEKKKPDFKSFSFVLTQETKKVEFLVSYFKPGFKN